MKVNISAWIYGTFVILGALLLIFWIVIYNSNVFSFVQGYFIPKRIRKIRKLAVLEDFLCEIRNLAIVSNSSLFLILLISVIFHINNSVIAFLLARSIGFNIAFLYFLVFIPLINLLLILPISVSGIGIRDLLFSRLYGSFSSASSAEFLGMISFSQLVILGLLGGLIYLFDSKITKVDQT